MSIMITFCTIFYCFLAHIIRDMNKTQIEFYIIVKIFKDFLALGRNLSKRSLDIGSDRENNNKKILIDILTKSVKQPLTKRNVQ